MIKELNISYVIKNLIIKLDLSINDFSLLLNLSVKQIYNYINNHNNPSEDIFNKIISIISNNNFDIYELFDVECNDNHLFHGSKAGISGNVTTKINIGRYIDFANGFYLSDSFKNAITYIVDQSKPLIYVYKKEDILPNNVFEFKKDIRDSRNEWVLYIGLNRGKISSSNNKELFQKYFDTKLKKYDVIIGEIADSYNFETLEEFFAGRGSINNVHNSLLIANIGKQYVLKNENIANKLKEVICYKIETRLKNYLLKLNRKAKENYKNMASELINNIENDLSFNDIKELYRQKVE